MIGPKCHALLRSDVMKKTIDCTLKASEICTKNLIFLFKMFQDSSGAVFFQPTHTMCPFCDHLCSIASYSVVKYLMLLSRMRKAILPCFL